MSDAREAHKVGCWFRNGGPDCTCSRGRVGPKTEAIAVGGRVEETRWARSATRRVSAVNFERGEEMLEQIKNFDPRGGTQLEDAMVLLTFSQLLVAKYDELKLIGVDKPNWLAEQSERIRQFVVDTVRDARKRKTAELRSRLDALKTPSERRAELERQLTELESVQ